jgi:hypothetical protein
MLTASSFVVRKETHRKVISLVEPDRQPNKDKVKKPKRETAGLVRRREVARTIVRYFQPYNDRRTVSVFGAKNITKEEMRLAALVAKRCFDFTVYFFGVAEQADSGPHGHFVAFKEVEGSPQPLSKEEETRLCTTLCTYLEAWRKRRLKNVRPSRFLLRKCDLSQESTASNSFYRVPTVLKDGKKVQSGIGSFALGYSLKTLLTPSRSSEFISSVGLSPIIKLVKSKQEVRVKSRRLYLKDHSTFRFALLSIVALEASKQLLYREPKDVCVFIKYGRVFVETRGGRLKLYRNVYLLVGLEILRRDLKDFGSPSVLRRAVTKICKALCHNLRQLSTEDLQRIAREQRDAIVWAAERKFANRTQSPRARSAP